MSYLCANLYRLHPMPQSFVIYNMRKLYAKVPSHIECDLGSVQRMCALKAPFGELSLEFFYPKNRLHRFLLCCCCCFCVCVVVFCFVLRSFHLM